MEIRLKNLVNPNNTERIDVAFGKRVRFRTDWSKLMQQITVQLFTINYQAILVVMIVVVGSSVVSAQSLEFSKLTPNEDVYVGWVAMKKADAIASKKYGIEEISGLLEPFIKMVESEYNGELENFQFRFHIGSIPYIIRGTYADKKVGAYLYQDGEYDFTEWLNIQSALTGPFTALDRKIVDQLSAEHQKHFENYFGPDVMLEDMQLSARRGIVDIILIGAMRWRAPRTHLHSIDIVIVIHR